MIEWEVIGMAKTWITLSTGARIFLEQPLEEFLKSRVNSEGEFNEKAMNVHIPNNKGEIVRTVVFTDHIVALEEEK